MYDRAETPPDRAAAVDTFLERTGLGARVVRWRAVAMLSPWLSEGWCVAGLLWVLDRHPDRPDALRGDATRSARDPLRVLGHRLGPWRGRLDELPPSLRSVDGHARRTRLAGGHVAATGADMVTGHRSWPQRPRPPAASAATRAAATAEVGRVLARPRRRWP